MLETAVDKGELGDMRTYHGSCHCGAVRFEIESEEIAKVTECNCSICHKKGALFHRVPEDRFRLVAGEDALTHYQFNERIARHQFCRHCGIHAFHRPRSAPDAYLINVRCLDDYDLAAASPEIVRFDGRNWEASFEALKR
jgi:hypothetical protein